MVDPARDDHSTNEKPGDDSDVEAANRAILDGLSESLETDEDLVAAPAPFAQVDESGSNEEPDSHAADDNDKLEAYPTRITRKSSEESAAMALDGVFPNQVIRASAGTGKTFALSNRYLKLLASGAECHSILATTFTKKGAGEILDRIIQRLSAAALRDEDAAELSKQIKFKFDRARAASLLHELLHNLHRLEISTLDSFFSRVARAFSLELGLPPGWEIVEEQQLDALRDQAVSRVLRGDAVEGLLHLMSKGEVQRSIESQISQTVNEVYRVVLESDREDWNRLPECNTFIPDDELNAMIPQMESQKIRQKNVTKAWLKLTELVRVAAWGDVARETLIQNVLAGNPKYGQSGLDPAIVQILTRLIDHCRAQVTTRLIWQNLSTYDLIEKYREILEPSKNETGMLRFDDVVGRLRHFVSDCSTNQFAFRLDYQIQHLLLDEFQDTSPSQWSVIRPFAQNLTREPDPLRSFFCVGDMKQAIYGWRGGVAEIFDLVDDELNHLVPAEPLLISYRSAPEVIDVVNDVFSNLGRFQSKKPSVDEAVHSWGEYFLPHETAKTNLEGYVTIEMAAEVSDRQKRNARSSDALDWPRNDHMFDATVKRIQQLDRDLPDHHSIGVLARTNDVVSQIIFKLQQAGIDASEEGGNPLTDSAAVNIILSALQLADHPGDGIARFHVSHSPLAGLFGLTPENDMNQADNRAAAATGAARLRERLVGEGYGPTIESLARRLTYQCTERELLRLQHLVRIAYASPSDAARWASRPGQFVRFIKDEVKVSDQSSARVRVMSIHKSKGLEFDVVVLPVKHSSSGWTGFTPPVVVGRPAPTDPINIASRYAGELDRNLLPVSFQNIYKDDRRREIRESMCVLYVGMTRAVHATHVVLTHGAKREHQSAGGLLLSSLELERKEGVIYKHGNPVWYEAESSAATHDEEGDPYGLSQFYFDNKANGIGPTGAELEQTGAKRAESERGESESLVTIPLEPRSLRGVPGTSPTQLVGGDSVAVTAVFRRLAVESAMQRGTLIHGCFDLVGWLDDGPPTREAIIAGIEEIDPAIDHAYRNRIAGDFQNMLKQPSIAGLLNRQNYLTNRVMQLVPLDGTVIDAYRVEFDNERPFAILQGGSAGMLEGFIDRLVTVYEGSRLIAADIIDYKTDAVDDGSVGNVIEYYLPQLRAYRQAVASFTGLPPEAIGCQIAFVGSDRVERVDLSAGPTSAKSSGDRRPAKDLGNETGKQGSDLPGPKSRPKKNQNGQLTFWQDE